MRTNGRNDLRSIVFFGNGDETGGKNRNGDLQMGEQGSSAASAGNLGQRVWQQPSVSGARSAGTDGCAAGARFRGKDCDGQQPAGISGEPIL